MNRADFVPHKVQITAALPSRASWRRNYRRQQWQFGLSFLGRLLVVGVLLYGAWLLALSDFLQVKTIQVQGAKYDVSQARVEKALANFQGRHLVMLSKTEVSRQLGELLPELGGQQIRKLYPATLVVEVKSQRPLVVLRQEYFEPRYVVSEQGTVVASVFGEQADLVGLLNIFMPAEFVKVEEQAVEQASFDVVGHKDDRTQGIEGIELGTAFVQDKQAPLAVIPAKVKQVPLELSLGSEVVAPDRIKQIQGLLVDFNYRIGVNVREVWYFPMEGELHLVTVPGWRIKFSLQRELGGQLIDLAAALQQANFVRRDFRYIDLRIANKIFVCRDQSCA